MQLLEFQAKKLLRDYGISVPKGVLVDSDSQVEKLNLPCVLKAQVPIGGRGKAGLVARVETRAEAAAVIRRMLGSSMRGYKVAALLAEEVVECSRELYLACLVDKQGRRPVFLASTKGGIDVEESARQDSALIFRRYLDPLLGPQAYQLRALAKGLQVEMARLEPVCHALWALCRELDADLVEINPVGEGHRGLIAMDAKIVLDDKARFRHQQLFSRLLAEQEDCLPQEQDQASSLARHQGLAYVPLEGDIGLIADGAGTGMLSLDLIWDMGGRPANFSEIGGISTPEGMRRAIEIVLSNNRIKSLLVSLIGGLTRMDLMARGIVAFCQGHNPKVPMVVRMCGTGAEEGVPLLQAHGVPVFEDLKEAVAEAIRRAREA